ncbi:hypothetical protein EVAR_63056_1 [Eumeta japonica]|uniref:Uncharacterized protein n=1 Tax=Eumeta variegata TaxID=151549 RepID=A0A4C1Z3N9_EUMVA|nr:hypothetical protein EVAR_63056_1 [Eumeta japonica]
MELQPTSHVIKCNVGRFTSRVRTLATPVREALTSSEYAVVVRKPPPAGKIDAVLLSTFSNSLGEESSGSFYCGAGVK